MNKKTNTVLFLLGATVFNLLVMFLLIVISLVLISVIFRDRLSPNVLSITLGDGTELEPEVDVDWRPLAFSKPASAGFADLVFAGYGIKAPELDYNDYADIDVRGRVVVYLPGEPPSNDPDFFFGRRATVYSTPEAKKRIALSRGALGSFLLPGGRGDVDGGSPAQ